MLPFLGKFVFRDLYLSHHLFNQCNRKQTQSTWLETSFSSRSSVLVRFPFLHVSISAESFVLCQNCLIHTCNSCCLCSPLAVYQTPLNLLYNINPYNTHTQHFMTRVLIPSNRGGKHDTDRLTHISHMIPKGWLYVHKGIPKTPVAPMIHNQRSCARNNR